MCCRARHGYDSAPLSAAGAVLLALARPGRVRGVRAAVCAVTSLVGALLVGACSSAAPAGVPSMSLGATVFSAAAAPRAPQVAGTLVSGGKLSLASYHSHVVVVNFWGSWCTVCRQEAPVLSAAARRFQPEGVRFLGVDIADNDASAQAFMRTFKITYPSLTDPGDRIALAFSRLVPIAAFPSTIVISGGGRVVGRIIGAAGARSLTHLIETAEKRSGVVSSQ